MITRNHARTAVLGVSFLLAAAGCRNQEGSGRPGAAGTAPLTPARMVVLDGAVGEWPERSAVLADEGAIYFRVNLPGQQHPLQNAPETLALWVDLDADAGTGATMAGPAPAADMGVDAVVEFSPRGERGVGPGVAVYALDGSGARTAVPQQGVQVIASPTFGAETYEVRMSRHADAAAAPGLAGALRGRGPARAMYVLSDASGRVVGWSDPERFSLPAAAEAPAVSDAVVPAKQPGTIRVLSYNVLRSRLMENPSPFARIFQVVRPDVILLQEWETDPETVKAWFHAVVTGEHSWHAVTGQDVAIVSPYPISPLGPGEVFTDESMGGEPRPVRVIAGLVRTPEGDVAAASLHLKCCGTTGTTEDRRRMAEARAINSAIGRAIAESGAAVGVIGGDYNLVGSRIPLDMLRVRADLDGTELAVAEPMVLGDAAMYTWRDPKAPFPPGRLDLMVYTDAAADVVSAFVIDTSLLSERSLARMGLDRTDTAASDHLPVVVDLRPR